MQAKINNIKINKTVWMGISIFGSWWLLPDYMHLPKLSNGTLEMINYAFFKKERERESNMGAHGKSHEWRSTRKQMGTWNEASPLIWSELVNSKQQTDLPGMKEGSHLRVRTQTETGCVTFVSHLTSLCFSFLSWKMCKMKHPSEKVWGRMKWANIRNIQHWFCTW